ncbi:MAG: hypothetical protein A3F40_03355, partial [Chlamydiae bacterium RIFCSPHIGHO2_12_FULL_27_8]
ILQCHKKHFLAAVAPLFFNLVWIFSVLNFNKLNEKTFIYILSISVVFAFVLQYLTTVNTSYEIIKDDLNSSEILKPKIFSQDIRNIFKSIVFSIIGIGAVQINSALDGIFALFVNKSAPAHLWYSMRLYQVPISFFGVSVAAALLPPLTRAFQLNDTENFKHFFNLSFKKCFSYMFFSTIAVFILGPAMINVIYGRGEFKIDSILNTLYSLYGYCSGLVFAAFVMILSAVFYAKKEYFQPMIASVFAVIINLILNYIFIFQLKLHPASIAYATSISELINFVCLLYFLNKNIKNFFEKRIFLYCIKNFVSIGFAAIVTIFLGDYLQDPSILFLLKKIDYLPTRFLNQLISFASMLSIFTISHLIFANLFKFKEILLFKKKAND